MGFNRRPERFDSLLPLELLAEQRDVHQLAHLPGMTWHGIGVLAEQRDVHQLARLLAHACMHLAEAAILLRELLRGGLQMRYVVLELRQ